MNSTLKCLERYKSDKYDQLSNQARQINISLSSDQTDAVIDSCKVYIEMVSKTILKHYNLYKEEKPDLNSLLSKTTKTLFNTKDKKLGKPLTESVKALVTLSLSIGTIRNAYGTYSHGRPADEFKFLDTFTLQHIVYVTDVVCSMLLQRFFDLTIPKLSESSSEPMSDVVFDEHIDAQQKPISFYDNDYKVSELIFSHDPKAYQVALTEYKNE